MDTTYGLINNSSYYKNSQYCDFKTTKDEEPKRLYPDDIYGYRFIDGKFYISKTLNNEKVFLEYLIKGNLDFFYLKDKNYENLYFVQKDTLPLTALDYDKVVKTINGKTVEFETKNHIRVLSYYTNDCPELEKKITVLGKPTHKNLIAISTEYHNLTCKNGECIVYEKKVPKKILFSLYGGMLNNTKLDDGEEERIYFPAGFQFLFQQSQSNERFFIGIGAELTRAYYGKTSIRIPFSLYYINTRKGLSPTFGAEIDLNTFIGTQAFMAGLNYKFNTASIYLNYKAHTVLLDFELLANTINMGMTIDLRK